MKSRMILAKPEALLTKAEGTEQFSMSQKIPSGTLMGSHLCVNSVVTVVSVIAMCAIFSDTKTSFTSVLLPLLIL